MRQGKDPVEQNEQNPVWPENENVVRPGHDLQQQRNEEREPDYPTSLATIARHYCPPGARAGG